MPPIPLTGPYVAVATFCERVLREHDNVISVMRVVDQLNINAQGPDVPSDLPPTPTGLSIALVIRRGTAKGRHAIFVRPEAPSGDQRDALEVSVNLMGEEETGVNFVLDLTGFQVDQEGLWWFDVLFGDARTQIARIPLRVNYHPQRTS